MTKQNKSEINPSHHPQQNQLPPALLERFLDIQQQEINFRTEELSLRTQQEGNKKIIAEVSISANLQDRQNEREHSEKKIKIVLAGVSVLLIISVCFACYAIYAGKDELVMKLIEISAVFASGFAGGYGYKSTRQNKEQTINNDK